MTSSRRSCCWNCRSSRSRAATVVVAEVGVVSIGDISLMAMNPVETLPILLLISYHYFLIKIDNAMEKDDVVVAAADVVAVAVVTTMPPPTIATTIAVDHDDSDIVDAVVEPQSLHDVMMVQHPWIHCYYYYCCCMDVDVVVVPEGRKLVVDVGTLS